MITVIQIQIITRMDIYKFPEKIQFLLKASLQSLLWLTYYNVLCQQLNFTF